MAWLSARGRLAVSRLERSRGWTPGNGATAYRSWAIFVRDPMRRLWRTEFGCGVWECCPDPAELRAVLAAVAAALPPRDAREFRHRVARLDDKW
ncbi:hypothetical protein FKR81_32100 [Lentzea tibetensis]|uniref:Uncharacterized protein n=1 Tax=Lentzea tibetensis TaxID=2591470 RepID=A0A563EKR5_9PSEU|nr:hypothetical protein FKR81_32100 [Lentzea tibetensis]